MIGQNILHYRIESKLGEGGMGEVFLAEDTSLDRQVALKFLPRQFSSDSEARLRFQREAKALAALNHPNIVSVYDVSEFEGQPFIAMEFVEGQSLKRLIGSGDVGIDTALDVITQASDGLAAAHKRDIVHRDIKSENIVMSSEGRVTIMDFGLATWHGITKITAEGSTLGTRSYMSPEQSLGHKVDHRTDLWSLGVVAFELITGRLPFTGEHDSAIAYSISSQSPEPLARYRASVSPELQRIVSKCLAKNPDERYQSAADLRADLRVMRSAISSPTHSSVTGAPAKRRRLVSWALLGLITTAATVAAFVWKPFGTETNEADSNRKMLAVLPFQNLGSKDQEYFADGMTEEITSRLASVSGLGVISRTSVMQYKETKKSLRAIGKELGVDYVLEGTIRWDHAGDTDIVRITPQLIRVKDDTHLWADRFDRPLKGIFAIQTDIAEQVVAALHIALPQSEKQALASQPTVSLEAHNYYLRGLELYDRAIRDLDYVAAVDMFGKAVALDSQYALAHAALSRAHARIFWSSTEPDELTLVKAREAAEQALRLDPNLSEAHLAMGYYHYWGFRDYDAALKEFDVAEKGKPNNSDLLEAIGLVRRRRGEWVEAYQKLKRALELDPASVSKRLSHAGNCLLMRRFEEGASILWRGIALYPELLDFYSELGGARYAASGNPEALRATLDSATSRTKVDKFYYWDYYLTVREYDSVLAVGFQGAVERPPTSVGDSLQYYWVIAEAYFQSGQTALSRPYYDSIFARIGGLPDSEFVSNSDLGFSMSTVYSGIGRCEDAIKLAKSWSEFLPISKDAVESAGRLHHLALLSTRCGQPELAIDLMDQLLMMPSSVTTGILRSNPLYDPLRGNPRFQAMIDRGDIVF